MLFFTPLFPSQHQNFRQLLPLPVLRRIFSFHLSSGINFDWIWMEPGHWLSSVKSGYQLTCSFCSYEISLCLVKPSRLLVLPPWISVYIFTFSFPTSSPRSEIATWTYLDKSSLPFNTSRSNSLAQNGIDLPFLSLISPSQSASSF